MNGKYIKLYLATLSTVVFAIVVLIIGLAVHRDNSISIKDEVITNRTSTSFTLTWVSDTKYIGKLNYTEGETWPNPLNRGAIKLAEDQRDIQSGFYTPRYTHYVTISGLKPSTIYSFRIAGEIVGRQTSINYIKTRELTENLSTPDPAYGKLEGVDIDSYIIIGEKANKDAEPQLVSSTISSTGTYSVDLNILGKSTLSGDKLYGLVHNLNEPVLQHNFDSPGYKPLTTLVVSNQQNTVDSNLQRNLIGSVHAQAQCPINLCLQIDIRTNIRADSSVTSSILSTETGEK